MRGADLTLEESLQWIRDYAEDALALATMMQKWDLDGLRVVAGLAVIVDVDTPRVRLFLCHRRCAPQGHFHAIVDRTDPRMCQRCLHLKTLHLHEAGQCVPGVPCTCEAFVPPPPKQRPHPDSPGYWNEDGWVGTGCRAHDLDPCGVCDVE